MISVTQQLLLNWENASAKGVASTWTHKVWFFTMMSHVTSFYLQHEHKCSSSADSVIFILCFFPFYENTYGSYLLTVTLPQLKCSAGATTTQLVCMINSWASHCVKKRVGDICKWIEDSPVKNIILCSFCFISVISSPFRHLHRSFSWL